MMDSRYEPLGDDSSGSHGVSAADPPVLVVAAVGDAAGSRAVAAALACAGAGGAQAPLFVDLGGPAPRPTLLASRAAKGLEERLEGSLPCAAAAARGGFCQVGVPADADGYTAAAAVVAVGESAPAVVHVPCGQLAALLDSALGARAVAALLCGSVEVDGSLAAPVVLELLDRGLAVAVLERRLGWVLERRALFGALRAKDLVELPGALTRWLADYAVRLPGPASVPSAACVAPAVALTEDQPRCRGERCTQSAGASAVAPMAERQHVRETTWVCESCAHAFSERRPDGDDPERCESCRLPCLRGFPPGDPEAGDFAEEVRRRNQAIRKGPALSGRGRSNSR